MYLNSDWRPLLAIIWLPCLLAACTSNAEQRAFEAPKPTAHETIIRQVDSLAGRRVQTTGILSETAAGEYSLFPARGAEELATPDKRILLQFKEVPDDDKMSGCLGEPTVVVGVVKQATKPTITVDYVVLAEKHANWDFESCHELYVTDDD